MSAELERLVREAEAMLPRCTQRHPDIRRDHGFAQVPCTYCQWRWRAEEALAGRPALPVDEVFKRLGGQG